MSTSTHQEQLYRPDDLEPSLVGTRTYVTRYRLPRLDAAFVIAVMIGLLLLIPARLSFPAFGALGRPAIIVADLMFAWWVLVRLTTHLTLIGPQPLRWIMLPAAAALLLSYAIGEFRGLTAMESNGADRTLVYFAAFAGAILMAADGLPNWLRLNFVLRVLVFCSTIMSLIGLLQYVTNIDISAYMDIPGMSSQGDPLGFEVRGAGVRVASTATHYIEFGAAMATVLPISMHLAIFARNRKQRVRYAFASLIIAAAVIATIPRTGLLALAVGAVVVIPVWTWRTRYNITALAVGLMASLIVVRPALFGTLSALFDDPADNPAFVVRQARYPYVFYYFAQRPWFGRGTGTFIPPQYQVLDNQWLAFLVSNGIVGIVTIGAVQLGGIVLAVVASRRADSREVRHLCACLVASQVIALVVAGTFDSWNFMSYSMVSALTLGLCGTVWRLTHPTLSVRTATPRWFAGTSR